MNKNEDYLKRRDKILVQKKQYWLNNLERLTLKGKKYYEQNKKYFHDYRRTTQPRYSSLRNRCFKKQIEFDLTKEIFDFITRSPCLYCGKLDINGYVGIDRINNFKGYNLDNCVPCCKYCNISKNNRSLEDFLEHIKIIDNHSNNRPLLSNLTVWLI